MRVNFEIDGNLGYNIFDVDDFVKDVGVLIAALEIWDDPKPQCVSDALTEVKDWAETALAAPLSRSTDKNDATPRTDQKCPVCGNPHLQPAGTCHRCECGWSSGCD